MGVMKQQATQGTKRDDKKSSGVDWTALANKGTADGVTWGDADPGLLSALIYSATRRGMAVSFSATANGAGVSLTILDGGDRPKWYANSDAELDTLLRAVLDLVK